MLEEEALDLTHYISHTGQVSLFGCVIEVDLVNEKNPKSNVYRECRGNARGGGTANRKTGPGCGALNFWGLLQNPTLPKVVQRSVPSFILRNWKPRFLSFEAMG